jgi:hypothetical protein
MIQYFFGFQLRDPSQLEIMPLGWLQDQTTYQWFQLHSLYSKGILHKFYAPKIYTCTTNGPLLQPMTSFMGIVESMGMRV